MTTVHAQSAGIRLRFREEFELRQRFKAFAIQLVFSTLAVVMIFGIVRFVWFPGPYFRIAGVAHILWVLIGVNFVLGPLLTFIVFDRAKKSLKFDLAVIVLMQLVALAYGVQAIQSERPRYMVFAVDRFNVLADKDVDAGAVTDGRFRQRPFAGPLMLVAQLPDGKDELSRLLDETLFHGKPDIERRPEYWRPYGENFRQALLAAKPLNSLREARPAAAAEIDRIIARNGREPGDLLFVPVVGKRQDFAVLLNRNDGSILDAIAVDPWLR